MCYYIICYIYDKVLICSLDLMPFKICMTTCNSHLSSLRPCHLFLGIVSSVIFMTVTLMCLFWDCAIYFQTEDTFYRDIFRLREDVNSRMSSDSTPPPDLFPIAPFSLWFCHDSILVPSLLGKVLLLQPITTTLPLLCIHSAETTTYLIIWASDIWIFWNQNFGVI
jgi:hypothetical protein